MKPNKIFLLGFIHFNFPKALKQTHSEFWFKSEVKSIKIIVLEE